jgi:hypothetical protein
MKKNDRVKLTEPTLKIFEYPDIEYTIIDILEEKYPYKYVLKCEDMGNDWVQFFKEKEMLPL